MAKNWKDLKNEINDLVENLRQELENEYKEDYKNRTVHVLVKFKDNKKNALVTIVHTKNLEAKVELEISLDNSQKLPEKFEKLLASFESKTKS